MNSQEVVKKVQDEQTKLYENTTRDLLDLHLYIKLTSYLHPNDRFGKAEGKKVTCLSVKPNDCHFYLHISLKSLSFALSYMEHLEVTG